MKSINWPLIGLYFSLITVSTSSFSMQKAVKVLPWVVDAAFFAMPVIDFCLTEAVLKVTDKKFDALPDMPKTVMAFVEEVVKECELAGALTFKCKMNVSSHSWTVGSNNYLICSKDEIEELNKELEKDNPSQQILLKAKQSIKHELAHILYEDNKWKCKDSLWCALAAYAGVNGLLHVIKKTFNIETPSTLGRLAFYNGLYSFLGTIVLKTWVKNQLVDADYRRLEARADKHALDHAKSKEEIESFIKNHTFFHENAKDAFNNPEKYGIYNSSMAWRYSVVKKWYSLSGSTKNFGDWIEEYPVLFYFLDSVRDSDHPLAMNRVKMGKQYLKNFDK